MKDSISIRETPPSSTDPRTDSPSSVALFLISSPSADAISLFTAFSTIFDVTISSRRAQSFTTIPILRTFVIRTVFLGLSGLILSHPLNSHTLPAVQLFSLLH
ncbi:hypothetical protein OIU77_017841 [Salix suchowensis]|uniref:Uncharacterized protein n=1 Tax=Salix suchowensis TaxID=1278906 RepID=A0ABQ8ZQR4_9ROSI|nr:hypothetical protein OIU77_017841 [Salix suchowensis]